MPNTKFGEIARTRQLDYCPTCAPERSSVDNLRSVLWIRNRQWFTCACGAQWWSKKKTGEVKMRSIVSVVPHFEAHGPSDLPQTPPAKAK